MEKHALAILQDYSWNWTSTKRIQESGIQSGKFESVTPRLLFYLISESQILGGNLLNQFWVQLGKCHPILQGNIERLERVHFVSAEASLRVLFQGLDQEDIDFGPMLSMATEYFTHLGIAFMNPGGRKSGTSTESSVSEPVDKETSELLELVKVGRSFGRRRQGTLKALSFKRDGRACLLTSSKFKPLFSKGIKPILAHIIPASVHRKPDTLNCIAMFAGNAARDEVLNHLNGIDNAMNLEHNAYTSYDDLEWGIEAKEEAGQYKYFFRMIPSVLGESGPGLIRLKEGDEIGFGQGPDGEELNKGPLPRLCNLRLAVARVLKMSGAAEIILDWKDKADDDGVSQVFISSEKFCSILDARLHLSGGVLLA